MFRKIIWGIMAFIYGAFFVWYTSFGGPLTQDEIQAAMTALSEEGAEEAEMTRIRTFLEGDDGRQFIMINLLDLEDDEIVHEGETISSPEVMGRYMEHMWPNLLSRACHPIFSGAVVAPNMEQVGIEGADNWERVAMMRYRSRRDLLRIAFDPAFEGPHDFKILALDKTIAMPATPELYFSDPRTVLALLFVAIGGLLPRRR